MRYARLLVFLLIPFFLFSCEEEEKEPGNSGKVTLSSRKLGTNIFYVIGFSFERGEEVPTTGSNGVLPDIVAQNIEVRNPITGVWELEGLVLTSANNNPNGFALNSKFQDLEQARGWFDAYTEAEYINPFWRTDTLRPEPVYPVYTYKTISNNYVKIVIRDVDLTGDDYGEVVIDYEIQRDGSTQFTD